MKKIYITLTLALVASVGFAQQKMPDTSRAPKVYWSDLIRLQSLNNELTKRIHKFDIPALKRDTCDMYLSEIGYFVPLVYGRTYRDTVKKVKK